MSKKYELVLDQSIKIFGYTLFRIRALISFADVSAGDIGGYVQSEDHLAQVSGDAWVYGNALVYGNAQVSGDAWVYCNAQVSGNALVYGDAQVSGNALVYGDAALCWFSKVGSEGGTLTAFTAKVGIEVTRGCFHGSIDEFETAVERHHGDSQIGVEYKLLIQFIRLRIKAGEA